MPVSSSPRFAGDGVMVVSVKLAVVNLPRVPPALLPDVVAGVGAEAAAAWPKEAVLPPPPPPLLETEAAEVVGAVPEDEAGAVAPGAEEDDDDRLEEPPPDDVLNAVIVSRETVGFFSLDSFICRSN